MKRTTTPIEPYTATLRQIFKRARSKRDAHEQSGRVLLEMGADPACLRAALAAQVGRPGGLNARHYPSVGLPIEHNAYFNLVANCFLPLPSRESDITCNSIHHHGNLLLSSVTAFGPGYEHWRFTAPTVIDRERELFSMKPIDRATHGLHDVTFVDSFMPHAVLYPPSLTVTFALWSSQYDVTWRERLKMVGPIRRRRQWLRKVAERLWLSKGLRINIEHYVDFYPTRHGFKGMRNRVQFAYGPNEDYLYTLFHIIQCTGNSDLVFNVELRAGPALESPRLVEELVRALRKDVPVAPRFSEGLHRLDHMNFKTDAIERTLDGLRGQSFVGRNSLRST